MKSIDVVAAIIRHGGKIEPGETPEQAIVREIREELGATIAVDDHLVTIDHDYETFHLHMAC